MDIGTILIYVSLGVAVFVIILSIIELILGRADKSGEPNIASLLSKIFSILLFIAVSATLLLLYIYFIFSNINIEYVWTYSSTKAPLEYKISGALAGMEGSLLFWIWCMTLPLFVEELKDLKNPKGHVLMSLTRAIMMIIIVIFLSFLIQRDLFAATPNGNLTQYPNGYGLNPLLQTPLMIAHPPIVFLAYGFIVICMASAMAYLLCNDKDWTKLSMPWSRWGWIFLTLGIGIGGLWAYTVLGWGGYWAWDPVETSSFVPWILLTAFLHAQLMHRRKGEYQFAAPALGIYSFALVIFATFTTRAGGIWQSVHAFGQADVSASAFDRFTQALNSDIVIMGYFVLLMGIMIIGAILLIWALIKRGGLEEDDMDYQERGFLEETINDRSLMFLTLILMTITTIVTVVLLIMAVNGLDRTQFDTKVGLFAIIGIALMAVCLVWKYLGRKVTLYSLLLVGSISLTLWVLYPDQLIVVASLPFIVLALDATLYKIIKSINSKSLRGTINGIAPHLVHLGVVFIIIGFLASTFLKTEEEIDLVINGPTEKVGDYEFRFVGSDYNLYESEFVAIRTTQNGNYMGTSKPGAVLIYTYLFSLESGYEQYMVEGPVPINLEIAFMENDKFLSDNAMIYLLRTDTWLIEDFISGNRFIYKIEVTDEDLDVYSQPQWRNEISVESTLLEDVYFIYNSSTFTGNEITSVNVHVKILPMMNVLWWGMWLMSAGLVMRLIVEYTRPKKAKEGRIKRRAKMRAEEEKSIDYYEDLIEKELEKIE
jgi:cytochrome c-type biogenesis protein CcmF